MHAYTMFEGGWEKKIKYLVFEKVKQRRYYTVVKKKSDL